MGVEWMWLGLGLGIGIVGGWGLRRSQVSRPSSETDSSQVDRMQQLELAYHLATEMSQFKGGFLARAAHELRSPLNGLIGMQQLILSDLCDSPEEERQFIAQANEAALKMVEMLDRVIDVSKTEHGSSQMQIQPVQLRSLLQDVQTLTQLQVQSRNLRLQVQQVDADLYVLADPLRLRQVLINLIDRGLLHQSEGSAIVSIQVLPTEVQIGLDVQSGEVLSEPIALLQSSPIIVPSPGLTWLVDQSLIEGMQGCLEVQVNAETNQIRIQCVIPLANED